MNLLSFASLYLLVGAGLATHRVVRGEATSKFGDAGLLLVFWPLYAPFLVQWQPEQAPVPGVENEFLEALERASETPLGSLLPDRAQVRRLAEQLEAARLRADEIDALLLRPEFSEKNAPMGRVRKIRYLRELGERTRRELDEIRELLAQLRVQAEVVRLAGDVDGTTRELTVDLLARIEGMDRVLTEEQWPARPS